MHQPAAVSSSAVFVVHVNVYRSGTIPEAETPESPPSLVDSECSCAEVEASTNVIGCLVDPRKVGPPQYLPKLRHFADP